MRKLNKNLCDGFQIEPEITQCEEFGRSMVEMLGVLAIMGVVGLIGIKMYTNAMLKHRANELIYEANKRATMVAMQITAGRDNLSVAEFQNPQGYVFGVSKANNQQFNITIDTVSDDICTQMKTFVGEGTIIRNISLNCTTLTFNNDLSKIDANCAAGGNRCNDPTYGKCCPSGFLCTTGGDTVGRCVELAADSECATNAQCTDPNKPWCKISIAGSDCNTVPKKGICSALGTSTPATIEGLGNVVIGPSVNWYAAKNWCYANSMRPLTIEEFQAYHSMTSNPIVSNGASNYGCAKEKKCADWNNAPYNSMWNGKVLDETAGDSDGLYKDRYSPVVIDIKKQFGNIALWTGSDFNNDPCKAFLLNTTYAALFGLTHNYSLSTICKE